MADFVKEIGVRLMSANNLASSVILASDNRAVLTQSEHCRQTRSKRKAAQRSRF